MCCRKELSKELHNLEEKKRIDMINKNNELAMIKRMAQEGEQLEKQQKERDRQRMMTVGQSLKEDMENKQRMM